jgi:hypothetical protein
MDIKKFLYLRIYTEDLKLSKTMRYDCAHYEFSHIV